MSSYTPPIFTAILFILWWSKNIDFFNLAVLASIGGQAKYSLPLVGRPGLEPGEVKLPVLQTGPLPATVYRPIFKYLNNTRGPSPYVHNLRVYSISEETQSELQGATPNFWPQSFDQFSRRNDYLQLSPTIQNCILNSIISINPIKN